MGISGLLVMCVTYLTESMLFVKMWSLGGLDDLQLFSVLVRLREYINIQSTHVTQQCGEM